eukprot:jgi/Galph1/163/GphlegSOOS_G4897.1
MATSTDTSEELNSLISSTCPGLLSWTIESWMAVLFPFLGVVSVCLSRQFLEKRLGIHYSVLVLLSGCIFGVMGCYVNLGELSASLALWVDVKPPELLLYVLLPPIVFESAINIDWFIFRKQVFNVFLLAFILVLAFTFSTAVIVIYILRVDWPFTSGAMFGAILSATDPIAVIALLKSSGASPSVTTLLEGESLFNDGSAYTLFYAFLTSLRKNYHENAGKIALLILKESLGAVGLGLLFGYLTTFFLHHVWSAKVEIGISVAVSYLAFYVAQGPAGVSGLICLVVTGLVVAADRLSGFSPLARDVLSHFWDIVSFLANGIVFFYSGFIATISLIIFWNDGLSVLDLVYIPLLYLILSVLRYFLLFLCSPILRYTVSNFSWGEIFLMGHSALRGPIALILSQVVFHMGKDLQDNRNDAIVARVVIWTAGFAILTLLINGTTVQLVTRMLNVTSAAKKSIFKKAEERLDAFMKESINRLKLSRWYIGTDWVFVETLLDPKLSPKSKRFRNILKSLANKDFVSSESSRRSSIIFQGVSTTNNSPFIQTRQDEEDNDEPPPEQSLLGSSNLFPYVDFDSAMGSSPVEATRNDVDREVLIEYRKRVLQGLRHFLQKQYIRGIVFPEVFRELESAIDQALAYPFRPISLFEVAEREEWGVSFIDRFITKRLASLVWFRWLASRILYGFDALQERINLSVLVLNRRHRLGTNLAAALWSAITFIRKSLNLPPILERELRTERLHCLFYLRGVEMAYPHVLAVVQTRNAAAILLTIRSHFIDDLFASGELDQQEHSLLQEDTNERRKLIHEASLSFKSPRTIQVLQSIEIFASLVEQGKFRSLILDCGERQIYEKGQAILKVGQIASGVYISIRGVAHLESSPNFSSLPLHRLSLLEHESLNTIYCPPGSVFGLESCLFQRPMIRTVVVDSECAHIFFLSSSHLHAVVAKDELAALDVYRFVATQIIKQLVPETDSILPVMEEELQSVEASAGTISSFKADESLSNVVVLHNTSRIGDDSFYSENSTSSQPEVDHKREESPKVPNMKDPVRWAAFLLERMTTSKLVRYEKAQVHVLKEQSLYGVLLQGELSVVTRFSTSEERQRYQAPCMLSVEKASTITALEEVLLVQVV